LIFFVATLNRAVDENGPSGSASAPAMARPNDLTPELALRVHGTEAPLVGRVAKVMEDLIELIRVGNGDLALRSYLMERIVTLAVLLWSKKNERSVEAELS
jgi:hypothetical protein